MKKITIYLSLLLCISSSKIHAQLFTEWNGSGNWSTSSNWSNGYGYGQLEFKGAGNTSTNNDLNPSGQWRLFFSGSQAYNLTGGLITFNDFSSNPSWVLSESSADQTINNALQFQDTGARPGWITTRNSGSLILNDVTAINSVTQLQFANIISGSKTTVNGILSGAKDIYIGRDENFNEQPSTVIDLNGLNTYTGHTFVDAGRVNAFSTTAMGVDADVFIANNGLFGVQNPTTVASIQERNSGNGGAVDIATGATLTVNGNDKGNLFQSEILGQGDLILNTTGSTLLIIYSNSSLDGNIIVKNGAKLKLSASLPNADITIESGGLLEIESADVDINSLTVNAGGIVNLNDNRRLKVTGNVLNEGTIQLSTTIGGDLIIEGDLIQNGNLINNNRAVFFQGSNLQFISGTATPIIFDYMRVDKSGESLTISEDIQINQPGGGVGYEQTNGTVEITAGKSMVLINASSFVKTGGNFTLNSTSTMYSSLIANTVTGTISYKRHVNNAAGSGASTTANDLISPPLAGMTFGALRTDPDTNILSGTIGGDGPFYLFGPFDNSSTNNYILYEESVDDGIVLDTGIGYRTGSTDGSTYSFMGTVETGTIMETITTPSGGSQWNLIGNPYPSYISLSEFLTINNSKFDANAAGVYGYDGTAADGWTVWNSLYALINPDAVITPGQGFFVASASSSEVVNFNPNMRTIGNTDDFILMRSTDVITNVKLKMETSSKSFETDIFFTEFSTLGLDPGFDASLFGGSVPSFALYSNLVQDNTGVPLGIQAVGETDYNSVTIPLGVSADQGEQLTFSLENSTIPNTVEVYLDDTLTNTSTLLTTSNYVFTPSTNLSGVGRFFLRFIDSALNISQTQGNTIDILMLSKTKEIVIKGQLLNQTKCYLYDTQGRLILEHNLKVQTLENSIDVSHLNAGIYIVKLSNNALDISKKLIIN